MLSLLVVHHQIKIRKSEIGNAFHLPANVNAARSDCCNPLTLRAVKSVSPGALLSELIEDFQFSIAKNPPTCFNRANPK